MDLNSIKAVLGFIQLLLSSDWFRSKAVSFFSNYRPWTNGSVSVLQFNCVTGA